ncbi:CHAT domain-containing protein [Primorskyibacter aestuariivivens]|uniref:CHAT domain-containing protein n=1 Tax=Primorskyibacter aestuariivivens TaxID=1888912 RepID=UPI00230196EB|nr:CHAT domain-containing protein [Primorskyibacter aestuariivivens]MDA7427404.1 CHAT domain-containing protein [Primorskyibacter aestuariivivens]
MRRLVLTTAVSLCLVANAVGATTRAEIRDRVFTSAQRAQASAAGQALAQAAGRIAAGSADLQDLLRQQQDMSETIEAKRKALADTASQSGAAAEAAIARLQSEIQDGRAQLDALDAQLTREFPEFRELTNPAPLSIAELQVLLRPDEALVMTLTDETYLYTWAVSKTDSAWTRAEVNQSETRDKVQALRTQLRVDTDNRAGLSLNQREKSIQPFDRSIAHELYQTTLGPLEHVISGARHLMVVFDGPLTSLPPAVLLTAAPQGDDTSPQALRNSDWLIKRHALTTLPTVSALRALRQVSPPVDDTGTAPGFVGFGDPLLGYRLVAEAAPGDTGVVTRGIYEDVRKVADLAPLPNTARELRQLAATMGAGPESVFLAESATESMVKSMDLSGAEVVAFATHGLLADGLPGLSEPALVFTPPELPSAEDDALLTASEAAQLELSADLVILSACDTAGSDGTPGAEGLSGLARAFIYAGARAILVSHWPVDDYAASVLTTGMLDRMYAATPRSRAEALQHSTLDLLNDTSEDRFAHPRIWAPFVVVGEGGLDG